MKRFIDSKFSINDQQEVTNYFRNEIYNDELEDFLKADWDNTRESSNMDYLLNLLHLKMGVKGQSLRNKTYQLFSKVAAILILPALITIAFLTYQSINQDQIEESWVEIHSPAGSRTNFQLPDGSKGWLNSSSSIKYMSRFTKNREVEISGEAWFDVVHKDTEDFKVKTQCFDIKVLGTQFNVTAYPNEESVQVSLDEGEVEILGKDKNIWTSLVPNQRITFNKKNLKFKKCTFDSKSYSSWKDGMLIFKNVPFSEIVQRVERKYNAKIIVHNESLNSSIFRATFEDETLDEICKLLAGVVPIRYEIKKRAILPDNTFSKNIVEIWAKE